MYTPGECYLKKLLSVFSCVIYRPYTRTFLQGKSECVEQTCLHTLSHHHGNPHCSGMYTIQSCFCRLHVHCMAGRLYTRQYLEGQRSNENQTDFDTGLIFLLLETQQASREFHQVGSKGAPTSKINDIATGKTAEKLVLWLHWMHVTQVHPSSDSIKPISLPQAVPKRRKTSAGKAR